MNDSIDRRRFLASSAAAAGMAALPALAISPKPPPETAVHQLYKLLDEKQRKAVCFDWDHKDAKKGLMRTRLQNNWMITKPSINSAFFNDDQKDLIRVIFEGMLNPEWIPRWEQQLKDDIGGYGKKQSIAIFGQPGTKEFQFVMTCRHLTLRCDGNSAEHVAFGGPMLYGHEGERLYEKPHHPNNVFWHQATEANKLVGMLDGKMREQAIVTKGMPSEEQIGFKGKDGDFTGVPVAGMGPDQKEHLQSVLKLLLEPFRASDRDEAVHCLNKQGGLDACHLSFYKEGDLGKDGIYDNWRIEGPSFVWHYRGDPHVHVWVNVADSPKVKLNAWQDSVGV